MSSVSRRALGIPSLVVCWCLAAAPSACWALPRTWIGANNDWIDGGSTANWNPADEPDADDEAIFNTANTVNLGSNNALNGLTMSGGIDLSTNGFDLTVDGLVQLSGASTNLFIGGAGSELSATDLTTGGGTVELSGGTLSVIDPAFATNAFLTINSGGTLTGNGTVNLDSSLVVSSILNNNGTLTALTRPASAVLPPPVGTLTINGGLMSRIDLDGSGEAGAVNVNRNQTLDINLPLSDAFNSSLDMFQNTVLDISNPWSIGAGATVSIDNGAVMGIPGIPAAPSTISGGAVTQTGGTLTVVDADGQLIFNAPYNVTGGTFTNNGHVTFNADASITTSIFDFDAGEWTVQSNAMLTINVADYDPGVISKSFDSELTLNNGDISVITNEPQFVMNGTLNMIADIDPLVTLWSGETVHIGNDAVALSAKLNVSGDQVSMFNASVTFLADADVHVDSGATLGFNASATFSTVNGGLNAEFTGAGKIQFHNAVNVLEAVTLNMVGGTVDLDGGDAVGDQITVQAALTINAATMESFGKQNNVGVNVIHVDALSGGATGSLTVNLDDPNAEWTINPQGTLALSNTNALATLLGGSDVNVAGSLNVTGMVGTAARIDLSGVANLVTAAPNGGLLLQNGLIADPNRLENGIINGPGKLTAQAGRALSGQGVINAPIDFDGSATLTAEGGTLHVNGAVEDMGTFRVLAAPAVLNLVQNLNLSISEGGIVMGGGTLQGGQITTATINPSGRMLRGFGTVSNVLINEGFVEAQGGTLLLTNPASDWDGVGNAGHLRASSGGTLHVQDNAPSGFGGSVIAVENSRVFTDGFDITFTNNASILLTQGTYESTNSVHINGNVVVGAGAPSTIKVQVNRFLEFEATSQTTLNGNLRLESNNATVDAGATFSGNGALVVPAGSNNLIAKANADINALVDVQGNFFPGGFLAVGRVDLKDYQQASTGKLKVELAGTSLNQYDRLVIDGAAQLSGALELDLIGGFVPTLGDVPLTIISTTGSVVGTFSSVVQDPAMPAGLVYQLNYLPTIVQLVVVGQIAGDYNQNGVVDAADYAVWRDTLGQVVAPSTGADGNGNGMIDDGDYQVWRARFGQTAGSGSDALRDGPSGFSVPEPAAGTLLSFGGLCLAALRRKSRCALRISGRFLQKYLLG